MKLSLASTLFLSALLMAFSGCSSSESQDSESEESVVETTGDDGDSEGEDEQAVATPKAKVMKTAKVAQAAEGEELDLAGETEATSSTVGAASPGILSFIGPDKGVSVLNIQWDAPIGQDNPGADCELRASKKAGIYNCVVRDAAKVVILTLHETGTSDARHISKMTLDGKGVPTWKRWQKELKDNGFKPSGVKGKGVGVRKIFISDDNNTSAEVVWVAPKSAVTVILKPAKKR